METIGSKRSYALTWCMPNNDDDDDDVVLKLFSKHCAVERYSVSHSVNFVCLKLIQCRSLVLRAEPLLLGLM